MRYRESPVEIPSQLHIQDFMQEYLQNQNSSLARPKILNFYRFTPQKILPDSERENGLRRPNVTPPVFVLHCVSPPAIRLPSSHFAVHLFALGN